MTETFVNDNESTPSESKKQTMKLLIFGLLISFVCVTNAYADKGESAKMDLMLQAFDKDDAPGLVVAVVKDGQSVYSNALGMANLEYAIENSDNTVFDTASVAKQFTGFAVATLIKEGKLTLDDPVQKYLPELEEPYDKITLRHLARHTSGVRDIGELYNMGGFPSPLTSIEALELIRRQSKLNFPCGSEYDYSNSNYVLLAIVVEKITGESLRQWSAKNIFKKLNMEQSFVNDDPKLVIKNRAVAYYGSEKEFSFDQNNGMALIGSSAVYSSLEDMQKWLKFLMATSGNASPTQLMLDLGKLDNGEPVPYGLGLSIHPYSGTTMVEHSGATPSGFRSQVAFFPKEDVGFVVLSNWGDVDVIEQVGKKIIDIYLGETLTATRVEKPQPDNVQLSTEQLQRFVGDFLFNEEANVSISVDEDQLILELEGRGKMPAKPIATNAFFLAPLHSKVQFIEDGWDQAEVFEGGDQIGKLKRKVAGEAGADAPYLPKPDLAGTYFNDEMDLLFSVEVTADGRLLLHRSAVSTVELVHRAGDLFRTKGWELSRVEFARDDSGRPSSLSIDSGSRCRDVLFKRR